MLVARIESFEHTYYIAEDRANREPVQDEALIEIVGQVEWVSPRHKQHQGEKVEFSLLCAQSFSIDAPNTTRSHPFLLSMNLKKGNRSCMAYLPSNVFWSIPNMIETSRVTHIEARFEPLHRGSGSLLSLYLIPETRLSLT
jgi:hypothetical protein